MASHIGMIHRNDAAQARIDTALAIIAKSGTANVVPAPTKTRDPKQNEVLRMEWIADTLEAIAAPKAKGKS